MEFNANETYTLDDILNGIRSEGGKVDISHDDDKRTVVDINKDGGSCYLFIKPNNVEEENRCVDKGITQYDVAKWIDHSFAMPCKCCIFLDDEVCDFTRCLSGIVDWLEIHMD